MVYVMVFEMGNRKYQDRWKKNSGMVIDKKRSFIKYLISKLFKSFLPVYIYTWNDEAAISFTTYLRIYQRTAWKNHNE